MYLHMSPGHIQSIPCLWPSVFSLCSTIGTTAMGGGGEWETSSSCRAFGGGFFELHSAARQETKQGSGFKASGVLHVVHLQVVEGLLLSRDLLAPVRGFANDEASYRTSRHLV